jgi:hypothetical protein
MSLIQGHPRPARLTPEERLTSDSCPRRFGGVPVVSRSVAGQMRGRSLPILVRRKGKVEVGPRAWVEGDITSQALAIAEGAVFIFIGSSIMGEETSRGGEREGGRRQSSPRSGSPQRRTAGRPDHKTPADRPTAVLVCLPRTCRRAGSAAMAS